MLHICVKCREPLVEMDRGCKICKPFKAKFVRISDINGECHEDSPREVLWTISRALTREIRALDNQAEYRKNKMRKEPDAKFDTSISDAYAKVSNALSTIHRTVRQLESDAEKMGARLTVAEQHTMLEELLARMPDRNYKEIIERVAARKAKLSPVIPFRKQPDPPAADGN